MLEPDPAQPYEARLRGKVVVVAGGAKGIGRASALRLTAEGAAVALGDIDTEALADTADSLARADAEVVAIAGDTTEAAAADALIAAAVERFGRVDGLVNVVGGTTHGHIWELSEEIWDMVIRRNLRSMFLCTRAALGPMMGAGSGRIVNIASGAMNGSPWQAYYTGAAPYSAAKAGVHGFTRDVALEVADHGITVNCVAPGPIGTERIMSMLTPEIRDGDYSPLKLTPMRRFGTPDEIAAAVAFFVSDDSSYITGQTLSVGGGR